MIAPPLPHQRSGGRFSLPQERRFEGWLLAIALLLILVLPLVYSAIVVPLAPREQAEAALAMIALAILASFSTPMRPLIVFLSCFASVRYFYWRVSYTANLDNTLDSAVSLLLLGAESYGLLILFLGYFQTIELTERTPPEPANFPSVDVFIPTYNEPVEIVRRTLLGALAIDYPGKTVYVLDDGRRREVREMVESLGANYVTRPDNRHAKAGNLNHAFIHTSGELIAIFDADHVPVRGFLRKTVGFFEDPKVALVQSAQHFFNPDPYERNLSLTGRIAPEQHFFYHVVQPGNDFWNSAFFCGSCAVLRRAALAAIGGIKTQTVTEDAHTALELHSQGYRSVYLRMPLAAGLATETFAAHVRQRMRWARGMAQILRLDCPLFKRGLSLPQRLNYFNAMLHFFFGIPRLVLMLAPLTYLYFGAHPIRADALAVIAYILPHIGLSTIANSMISRRYRHSFWAAVYEVSIAPYIAGVTLLAILNPRLGKFNVTEKGANVERARFDLRNSWFTLLLLALSLGGLVVAFPLRLLAFWQNGTNPAELDSILLNSIWVVGNLFILVAAVCVGLEQPQQRRAPRVMRRFSCDLRFEQGVVPCRTLDLSESGVRVLLDGPCALPEACRIHICSDFGVEADLPARRVRYEWNPAGLPEAAFSFSGLSPADHRRLVELIFSGDRGWLGQHYSTDRVLRSFWYLLTTFWRVTRERRGSSSQAPVLKGRRRVWYRGREFTCTAISGAGATLRWPASLRAVPKTGPVRIASPSGVWLEVDARAVQAGPGRLALRFSWPDYTSEKAFWETLYAARASRPCHARKLYFWKWIEVLK
ncbi:MAG TPA: UDP-forming cellulose synthase catalytic subunit [Bryobacteraceae bacterium]|nr:UDP-forming cellulose synthase catalytic subunit [Bryobacteraceae bacterium]